MMRVMQARRELRPSTSCKPSTDIYALHTTVQGEMMVEHDK